jgi:hypothetical protein
MDELNISEPVVFYGLVHAQYPLVLYLGKAIVSLPDTCDTHSFFNPVDVALPL